jgi:hypothetical protein
MCLLHWAGDFSLPSLVNELGWENWETQSTTSTAFSTWPHAHVHSDAKVLGYERAQRECGSVWINWQR